MIVTPFPPLIAEISAENARRSYESRQRDKPYIAAGYREPDGKLHFAYDLYNPMLPEGCTAGLVKITPRQDGFDRRHDASDFVPADRIFGDPGQWKSGRVAKSWDRMAVAVFRMENTSTYQGFVSSQSQEHLDGLMKRHREAITFKQFPIKHHPGHNQLAPAAFFLLDCVGERRIYSAGSADDLVEVMAQRLDFLRKNLIDPMRARGDVSEDILQAIAADIGASDPKNRALVKVVPEASGADLNVTVLNDAFADLISKAQVNEAGSDLAP